MKPNALPPKASPSLGSRRGVSLFEVLLLIAIFGAISGGVAVFAFDCGTRHRATIAVDRAARVRDAASLFLGLELRIETMPCPTVQDLVDDVHAGPACWQ